MSLFPAEPWVIIHLLFAANLGFVVAANVDLRWWDRVSCFIPAMALLIVVAHGVAVAWLRRPREAAADGDPEAGAGAV
jgi:hypothetical protein